MGKIHKNKFNWTRSRREKEDASVPLSFLYLISKNLYSNSLFPHRIIWAKYKNKKTTYCSKYLKFVAVCIYRAIKCSKYQSIQSLKQLWIMDVLQFVFPPEWSKPQSQHSPNYVSKHFSSLVLIKLRKMVTRK